MNFTLTEKYLTLTVPEWVVTILLIIYILYPIDPPTSMAEMLDGSLGMIFLFIFAVCLFKFTSPIVGVMFILAAYELLRRSSIITGRAKVFIDYTPSQVVKDAQMQAMNPPVEKTLEESMVDEINPQPLVINPATQYVESSFQPIQDKILPGASMV